MKYIFLLFLFPFFFQNNSNVEWLTPLEHDFGDVMHKEPAEFNFVFKNTSSDTMLIDNVRTTCGCTTPDWTWDPIAPDSTSSIFFLIFTQQMIQKYLLTFIFFFHINTMMSQSKPKLIYFGDPMCSWCYGFSPEMEKAIDSLSSEVDFQMVMGGLRPYNTETMKDLGDFLQHHWEEVGSRSGQSFSYEILKDTSFVYDTEPACRAVVLMRELKPEKEFEFFHKVQNAFYFKNKNTL